MSNMASQSLSPLEARMAEQQSSQRPRTSYPHQIQHFFRATRKKSMNDLSAPTFSTRPLRPRTGSEACLSRPTYLATSNLPYAMPEQRIDSGLQAQPQPLQRSSTVRARGSHRTRSSIGNWFSSINDFRKEAGSRLKSKGHSARRNTGLNNMNGSTAVLEGVYDAPDYKSRIHHKPSMENASIAGPRGRTLEHLPAGLDTRNQSPAISPFGGDGARASAAALARLTEKTRQLEVSDPSDFSPMLRRVSNSNDAESGIGVSMCSTSNLATEPRIAGHDPAELPVELFSRILTFLDADSLLNAELVSKTWNGAARSDHVWKHTFYGEYIVPAERAIEKREFAPAGGLGLGKDSRGPQEWKTMWRTRKQLEKRWQDGHAAAIYLEGHKDSVYCAQFDERKVATGSRDWTVRIWDMETLQCTHVLGSAKDGQALPSNLSSRKHEGKQPFKSIVPESSESDPIYVENEENHTGSVLCMQYDKDIMVTGSSDTTLIVWDMKDYKVLKRLRHHRMGVLDICFDDKYIVACSKDTSITIWSRKTFELVKTLEGHRGPVNAVSVRGDLVCSASGDGIAKLWNITTGLCIKEFKTPPASTEVRGRGLACVEFTNDGRIMAGGNDKIIYQFNTVTGSLEHRFEGHEALVRSLHYDAANSRVVSGSYDGSVKAYDLKTQEMVCDFKDWTTSWMLSAKSDYRRIVATSQDSRAVIIDFGHELDNVHLLQGNP